jgi:hypothetical protein
VRVVAAAVSAFVLTGALVGCSGDEREPSTLPPLPSAKAPSAPPSAPTSTPGALSPASAEPLPSEAQAPTPAGAAAFARYFFEQVNAAYTLGRPELIANLSDDGCGSCASVAKDVARLVGVGHSVDGQRYKLSVAEAAPADAEGRVVVDFRFDADPYIERDARKRIVREFPSEPSQDGQVALAQQGGQWLVQAIRLVKA